MQTRLREEIDGDFNDNYVGIVDHKTKLNNHEINCSECNKTFYADKDEYEKVARVIEQGLDNPFICDECRTEFDELAHQR